jgi:hypothetical protein
LSWLRTLLLTPKKGTSARRQKAGGRRQKAEGRRQEAGDRRQETGDRRQETGDRRQETGDRRQETGDRRQEAEGKKACTVSFLTFLSGWFIFAALYYAVKVLRYAINPSR